MQGSGQPGAGQADGHRDPPPLLLSAAICLQLTRSPSPAANEDTLLADGTRVKNELRSAEARRGSGPGKDDEYDELRDPLDAANSGSEGEEGEEGGDAGDADQQIPGEDNIGRQRGTETVGAYADDENPYGLD